jgi:hypothetical protein
MTAKPLFYSKSPYPNLAKNICLYWLTAVTQCFTVYVISSTVLPGLLYVVLYCDAVTRMYTVVERKTLYWLRLKQTADMGNVYKEFRELQTLQLFVCILRKEAVDFFESFKVAPAVRDLTTQNSHFVYFMHCMLCDITPDRYCINSLVFHD